MHIDPTWNDMQGPCQLGSFRGKSLAGKDAAPEFHPMQGLCQVNNANENNEMPDTALTTKQMADLLDVHPRTLIRLADEGKIHRAPFGRGLYWQRESVRTYVAHLRAIAGNKGDSSDIDLTAERARLAKEQADKAALQNAQLRAELVPVKTVESAWLAASTAARRRILAVPSRLRNSGLGTDMSERLDRELRKALTDLADNGTGAQIEQEAEE